MILLCLIALSISGYLANASFNTGEVAGCSGGEVIDCDHVLHSKFSKVLGIPVSVPAFALYATMLSVLVFFRKSASDALLKSGWMVLTFGSLCAAGAAVWFTGLQFAEWKFCPYCLGAHTCGLILATIVLATNPLKKSLRAGFGGLAMTGTLALIAIQWQSEEAPSYVVETYDEVSPEAFESPDGAFSATEPFGAPGEPFAAPGMADGPLEFAPPVFTPPGIASNVFEAPGQAESDAQPADSIQSASLVPPPVDITAVDDDTSDSPQPPSEPHDSEVPELLPAEAFTPAQPETKIASAGDQHRVEDTPPMEVPVILPEVESVIQRVDFREDQSEGRSNVAPKKTESDKATAAPATSKVDPKPESEAKPGQTAITPPSGRQASAETSQADDAQPVSSRAMAYLFFSASGATNAHLSEVLILTSSLCVDNSVPPQDEETTPEKPAEEPRLVVVAGNRFSLNPNHWPLIGDPDADLIFVEMFDYTCPHCRVTNKAIEGAFQEFGDRLAVLTLPVPLERACNPTVVGAGKAGACEMAKLGVAVWRIDQPKFRDYHHYMCDSQRTVTDARAKAVELVGKEKLDAEMALPYAADYIKKHVELYRRVGEGSVPKLMFPRSTMTGEIRSASTLVSAIKRELDN